jgi:hypothetical protein
MLVVAWAAFTAAAAALVACRGSAETGAPSTADAADALDPFDALAIADTPDAEAKAPPVAAWTRAVPTTDPRCLSSAAFMDNRYVVVGGTFSGTADLGLGAVTSAGAADLFLLALDADGAPSIARTYPSARGACGGMVLDGDGLISLVGGFGGDLSFGATQLACRSSASACATNVDGYLASISLDAVAPGVRYARQLGAPSAGVGSLHFARASAGRDLAITAVGTASGVVDLGFGSVDLGAAPAAVIVRVDSAGTPQLGRAFSASGGAEATDVAVSSSDSALVAGGFRGRIRLHDTHAASGGAAGFVVMLGGDGTPSWERLFGDGSTITGATTALATDLSGAAIVVGQTHDLGRDASAAFVWKGDHAGREAWTRTIATRAAGTRLLAAATDVSGNVFVGGEAYEDVGLDGQRITHQALAGGAAGFVFALDPAGRVRWGGAVGGVGGEAGVSQLSVTRAGALLVTGWFRGRVAIFGKTHESAGRSGFVAKVVP